MWRDTKRPPAPNAGYLLATFLMFIGVHLQKFSIAWAIQAFSMAIANKINATALSANRAKVCIYLLSPLALDLPFDAPQENPSLMLRPHLRVAAPLR